jgi:hypothetical protein
MNLAVFVIIIEMSIGFLAGIGYYPTTGGVETSFVKADQDIPYIVNAQAANESLRTEWMPKEGGIGGADYLQFTIDWITAGFTMMLRLMQAFLAISTILYNDFKIPLEICAFVQGIVYMIYTWGFIQWQSGRGGGGFE